MRYNVCRRCLAAPFHPVLLEVTMKKIAMLACLIPLIIGAGCSTISVNTDFDGETDFTTYQSYAWGPRKHSLEPGKPLRDSLAEKRIKRAVADELAAKGYIEAVTGRPDFLIFYHIGSKKKIDVDVYGYRYGWRGRWYGRNVRVHRYKKGTLVLDFVDPEMRQLVWRGWATGIFHDREEAGELISEGVKKILQRFPPQEK
jgi:hypothetical protein